MKILSCFIFFIFVFGTALSEAQTMYVEDLVKINIRSGKGTDFRIVSILKSGQSVEVIKKGDEWTKVRLLNGKKGWVLTRLLTFDQPCMNILSINKKELAMARQQANELAIQNNGLKEQNTSLEMEFKQQELAFVEIENKYENLLKESAELFSLKRAMKEALVEAESQKKSAKNAEKELEELKRGENYKWFLTGAGVLFVGYLLGGLGKARRSSSLLR